MTRRKLFLTALLAPFSTRINKIGLKKPMVVQRLSGNLNKTTFDFDSLNKTTFDYLNRNKILFDWNQISIPITVKRSKVV